MNVRIIFLFLIVSTLLLSQSLSHTYTVDKSIEFIKDGKKVQFPFSGGYQSLYAQIVDFELNGLIDLILLNNGFHKPHIFEQSEPFSLNFINKSIELKNIDLDRWFQFVDFNFDGNLDVLTLDDFDVIGIELNSGTNTNPIFNDFFRLKDDQDNLITTELGNFPVVYDYDGDDRFDLFLSTQTDGRIIYYKNIGTTGSEFQLITNNFGNVNVVSLAKHEKHGKSTFTFTHLSDPNRLDILWGDQFQQYFYYLTNQGDLLNPDYIITNTAYSANGIIQSNATYNVPIPVYLTDDNFEDLIVLPQFSNTKNFQFYTSTNINGVLELQSNQFISTIDEGLQSYIDSYDLDSDGLKDLIISTFRNAENFYHLSFYKNIGSPEFPKFSEYEFSKSLIFPWQNQFVNAYDFQIIDLNSDLTWDIVFVDDSGNLRVTYNSGTNQNPVFSSNSIIRSGLGNFASFKIFDINSDSRFELISASQSGFIQLFGSLGQLFDQIISSNLLNFQYDSWINIDHIFSNRFMLYHPKDQTFFTFIVNSNLQSDSLQLFDLDIPETGKSPSLSIINIDNDLIPELAFGNENGGLIILTAKSEIKPNPEFLKYPIYPNPSSNIQHIGITTVPTHIAFYNLIGQKQQIDFEILPNLLKWTFPKQLAAGIYFVIIDEQVYKIFKIN